MKKMLLTLVLTAALLLTACGGGGKADGVEIPDWKPSEIYTDADIEAAFKTVEKYFAKEFDGCTLTKLWYPGDSLVEEFWDCARRYGADEAIVLYSCFNVGSSGGDGSLNPNSTYEDWSWTLIRSGGGRWEHADHGYF